MTPLYRRQLGLSAATVAVAAVSVGLARVASEAENDVVSMGASGVGLVAIAALLVAAIRHATVVARYTFRGTREDRS